LKSALLECFTGRGLKLRRSPESRSQSEDLFRMGGRVRSRWALNFFLEGWWRLRRTETRRRMHAETDWATRDCPELAHQLHKIDNLAVRADKILRGTSENIVMQLLLAAASHVLSYVDRIDGARRDAAAIKKVVARSEAELVDVRQHYRRAGENASRIVYAGGMLRGTCLLAALTGLAGLILWAAGDLTATTKRPGHCSQLSVPAAWERLSASCCGWPKDHYEVGRKTTRRLAMARPFVGAAFAVVIYLLLRSGLVDVGGLTNEQQTIYFYAAVGFLAGFSERWARVIVVGVIGDDESSTTTQETQGSNGRVPDTKDRQGTAHPR
jgi:hypothetical protein